MLRLFLTGPAFCLICPAASGESVIIASTADAAPAYESGPNTYSRQRLTDTNILVGRQGTSGVFHQAAVFPFQLPDFGAVAAPFTSAELIFRLALKESVSAFNLDLYGLPSRTSSGVLPSSPSTTNRGDFFMGGFLGGPTDDNTSGVMKIQDNIATASTPDGQVTTNPAGSTQLATWLNAQYNNGNGAGRWVFLRLSTDAVPSGIFRYTISSADNATPENRPRIRYNFTPEPETLYTRIGTDPTFQQLIDSGVIVPGVSSSPGPVNGSTIDVNNSLLEQQTGVTGPIEQGIRIHTQVNSSVLRSSFPNFTRWYQEDGKVQVMRLFQGEQNVRSGIGEDGTPGRIEAFIPPFVVDAGTWSVWEGIYTIIEPLQSNIFQLFHEGGQLWAFHLRMTDTGAITFNRRSEIAGLPTNITIATNMVGQSIGFRIRANGRNYEVYKKIPFVDPDWVLLTTGRYTQAVDNKISMRWGMYFGSQAGQSIPKDGLLFVSGAKRSTEASSNDDPPPTPPPPVTYYWDNNGATSGFGTASGVWGETTTGSAIQGWSTSSGGTVLPQDVSTNATDPVFFGTDTTGLGAGTITVSDTVSCSNITFGSASGNITLNGGEIQMYGNRSITLGGGTQTIRSVLAGDSTRTIAGTGTLVLTGANEFSGPLVIGNNSGGLTLRINSIANADGTPSAAGAPITSTNGIIQIGVTSNSSTLELRDSTAAQSTNRRIRIGSDGGGAGGATIRNNNSNPAHTLNFTNSAFNVAATDTSSFNRTLTLRGTNTGDNLIQGAIINNIGGSGGRVALTKNDNGTWVLAGANTYSDPTTISGGTLRIGDGGTTGSLSPSSPITNNGILEFRRSNTITQGTDFTSGAISGTGALVQSGGGTTILNVNNTYQGLTTINAGALRILNAGALGSTAAGTVVNGSGNGSGIARLELAGGLTVSGEALTISGGGNFRGALTSQSGVNVWAGNVAIAAPETRIGAHEGIDGSAGATLRVTGVIDSGGQAHGLIIRCGGTGLDGTVVLAGANTYLGDTHLIIGRLQLDGGNNRLPVATRLFMGNAGDQSEFDLNGRSQEIAGLALRGGVTTPGNNVVTNSSATLSTLTVNTAEGSPFTFDGILNGNLALTKTGADTLTLTGPNNHSGTTTIGDGTLVITTASSSLPGGLTFGTTAGAADTGTLDLSDASASFGGPFVARTNSAATNTIDIGGGRTLQLNGAVTVGYNTTALPHSTTRLDVAGEGTLAIGTSGAPTNADVQIGAGTTTNVSNAGILDLSVLSTFTAHLGTGTFRIGSRTNSGGGAGAGSTAILAGNSIIHAAELTMAAPDSGMIQTLRLGSGSNEIHANTINVGGPASLDGRSSGQLIFNGSTGTLRIRSQADPENGRATLNVGNITMNTGVSSLFHLFDTTGHQADLRFATMTVGSRTSPGTLSSGNSVGEFKFDNGTLDTDHLVVGSRTGSGSGLAATGTGTVSIGGGTVTVNNINGPVQLGSNTFSNGTGSGMLHVSGGTVTVAAHGGNSIRLGNATVAGGTATGTLNLTGGTLSVAGHIIRGASAGTSMASLTLNGATLDMAGHHLTGLTAITFTNGTLRNLGIVNTGMTLAGPGSRIFDQGAGVIGEIQGPITGSGAGLDKQGGGMLTLTGSNTYNGPTTVSAGTLALVGTGMASPVIVANGASLAFTLGAPAVSSSSVNLSNGTVKINGSVDNATSFTLITASGGITGTPALETAIPGYKLQVNDNGTRLVLAWVGGYAAWAATYAGGQGPGEDFDNDGVTNGIEFFLNATPGFTALPVPDATHTITWTNGGNIPASGYGTRFVIQTSSNLANWTDVPLAGLIENTGDIGTPGKLVFTLTGPAPKFARILVTPE
jgi:autotransporter-associated beta strand protein